MHPSTSSRHSPLRSYALVVDIANDANHNSCYGPISLQSRLDAVDQSAARRKFALYGRQHAHVDHLSEITQDTTIILKSTMVLQEDGLLAAKLEDVKYLLDGLLSTVKTPRERLAQTRSILELTQLLQDPKVVQSVELSNERCQIQSRIKEMLLTRLRGETREETCDVSLGVLVYFLSKNSEAEEYFNNDVLSAVVNALQREAAKGDQMQVLNVDIVNTSTSESTQRSVARTKRCLKRKQRPCPHTSKLSAAGACTSEVSDESLRLAALTAEVSEESVWMKLDQLLHDDESFYVEGELHVGVISALYATLYNLLYVGAFSSPGLAQRYERHQCVHSGDAAEDTFRLIRARKYQLVRNGGIDVLMRGLAQRLNGLESLVSVSQGTVVTLECARSLHGVGMLLGVLDQATFLASDVQCYISHKKGFFALLLKLIELLSELSWGIHAHKRWESNLTRMSLAMEVLLLALRVLLNLTHHNLEAARQIFVLDGMRLLAVSFAKLRGLVATAKERSLQSFATNKWEFDACLLLLSVMVNSVEFSEENRDALTTPSLHQHLSPRGACDLFTRFFLAKLQSYKHLIEAQDVKEAIPIEDEGDDWDPEDVILGGCTSLLLGYMMKGSPTNCALILNLMPDCSTRLLLRALSVFVAFHSQIGALTPDVANSVLHVEKILKSCEKSEHDTCHRLSPAQMVEKSVKAESIDGLPTSLRARSVRNVCSSLDNSDDECKPHRPIRDNARSAKVTQTSCQNIQAIGCHDLARTPPRASCEKRPRAKLSTDVSPASPTRTSSPLRASRSSLIAIRPDGSLSSSAVARLLKRTRELVEEFDIEFTKTNRTTPEKKAGNCNKRAVDNAALTCRENGNELDLRTENRAVTDINHVEGKHDVRTRTPSKHKAKTVPDLDGAVERAVAYDTPIDALLSTPERTQKRKAQLQTPTKDRYSPGFYRLSPSLNLTPTKTTPSAPLRLKKSTGLLRTPMKSDHSSVMYPSPLLVSPHRRKIKATRTSPSARSSAIFDFTD